MDVIGKDTKEEEEEHSWNEGLNSRWAIEKG